MPSMIVYASLSVCPSHRRAVIKPGIQHSRGRSLPGRIQPKIAAQSISSNGPSTQIVTRHLRASTTTARTGPKARCIRWSDPRRVDTAIPSSRRTSDVGERSTSCGSGSTRSIVSCWQVAGDPVPDRVCADTSCRREEQRARRGRPLLLCFRLGQCAIPLCTPVACALICRVHGGKCLHRHVVI